eukprot:1210330-Rhodomonas_salina.2
MSHKNTGTRDGAAAPFRGDEGPAMVCTYGMWLWCAPMVRSHGMRLCYLLCARYAMSGTEIAYGVVPASAAERSLVRLLSTGRAYGTAGHGTGTAYGACCSVSYTKSGTNTQCGTSRYAIPGTDTAYGTVQLPTGLRDSYAMPGTDPANGTTLPWPYLAYLWKY